MKKVSIVIIFIVIVITVILLKGPSDIQVSSEDTVTLITFPSPPKYKTIKNDKDVIQLIDYINSLDVRPVFHTGKGWWFMMKINDHSMVTFVGDIIN